MPTLMSPCPTCGKPTPHRSAGVKAKQTEPDGRVYQEMECAICNTSTKVYFKQGTKTRKGGRSADQKRGT